MKKLTRTIPHFINSPASLTRRAVAFTALAALFKELRHRIARSLFALCEKVAVGSHCSYGCAVSERCGYGRRVDACLYFKRGEQMPECVYAVEWEAVSLTLPHQPGVRRVWVHRLAVPLDEQPVVFNPLVTDADLVLVLLQLVLFEQLANRLRHIDRSR